MATSQMNIPKTISVGFQERGDTYTGKLAYVVYTDAKGVLRKEKSWNGWRDNKIDPEVFNNEPTSGFVLNKGVGGARNSWGWNARNEYIRVYDPRGFEFEISVSNLLFILQECTSTKGKGLEGEFVYSWDRADLVLLPVDSLEYTECVNFTDNQTKKVTKKDMVEGCSYIMRDMVNVMYLGRHDWFEPDYSWGDITEYYTTPKGKKHIFLNIDDGGDHPKYIIQTGFTKLAEKTSDQALSNFASAYDEFVGSIFNAPATEVKLTERPITLENLEDFWYKTLLLKKKDKLHVVEVTLVSRDYKEQKEGTLNITLSNKVFSPTLENGKCSVPKIDRYYSHYPGDSDKFKTINVTREELLNTVFYTVALSTGKGEVYNIING